MGGMNFNEVGDRFNTIGCLEVFECPGVDCPLGLRFFLRFSCRVVPEKREIPKIRLQTFRPSSITRSTIR